MRWIKWADKAYMQAAWAVPIPARLARWLHTGLKFHRSVSLYVRVQGLSIGCECGRCFYAPTEELRATYAAFTKSGAQ